MISRTILLGLLGLIGLRNLYPAEPEPIVLTAEQVREKAKHRSVSDVCSRKKKQSKTVQDLCKRWEKHDA